ncbi:MAG: DUF5060 domain-containing protein, partial [Planctomycetaceae bacterium]|nr:DUF5060 domain-containing protein [Planctomycetaceae bacterium]
MKRVAADDPQQADGDGKVVVAGELRCWHKITLTQAGPFANERDDQPNPFTDYRMTATFSHTDGTTYTVPGYFAADGNAGNSSAESGHAWRAHFAPDRVGRWTWKISFRTGNKAALYATATSASLRPYDGVS